MLPVIPVISASDRWFNIINIINISSNKMGQIGILKKTFSESYFRMFMPQNSKIVVLDVDTRASGLADEVVDIPSKFCFHSKFVSKGTF